MIVNNEKTRDLGSGRAYSVPEKTSAINQAPRNMRRDKLKNKTLRHESDITKSRRWRPRGEAASKIQIL